MWQKSVFFIYLLIITNSLKAQEELITLKTATGSLKGSIIVPAAKIKMPLVLLISGSGPTDRDGNNPNMTNNSLKMLAEELAKSGIASVRYDKRGVAASSDAVGDISAIRFEDMSDDAQAWLNLLSHDKRFSKIIVAGHSEGSLVGMVAINKSKGADAFISLAGAGRPADEILKEQLGKAPDDIKKIIFPLLDRIKNGDTISNVPPILYSLFHPSLQAYMSSWFKYNPQQEIKSLKVPVLIVQGTTDRQVKEIDAELLNKAKPGSTLKLIVNMNHVLKNCESMNKELQDDTYTNPDLPLTKELVKEITEFIINVSN